jgi:hypothetical protein
MRPPCAISIGGLAGLLSAADRLWLATLTLGGFARGRFRDSSKLRSSPARRSGDLPTAGSKNIKTTLNQKQQQKNTITYQNNQTLYTKKK